MTGIEVAAQPAKTVYTAGGGPPREEDSPGSLSRQEAAGAASWDGGQAVSLPGASGSSLGGGSGAVKPNPNTGAGSLGELLALLFGI